MRYALLGLLSVLLLAVAPKPDEIHQIQTPITEHTQTQEIKREVSKKKAKTVTWKSNPKKCNTKTHFIAKEKPYYCIQKSTGETKVTVRKTGNCSLVNNYSNWDTNVAYAVCMAESGGNSQAANWNDHHSTCTGSFGLMQLACFHTKNPLDPIENMRVANQIYSRSGWQPWGAFTSGAYLRFL